MRSLPARSTAVRATQVELRVEPGLRAQVLDFEGENEETVRPTRHVVHLRGAHLAQEVPHQQEVHSVLLRVALVPQKAPRLQLVRLSSVHPRAHLVEEKADLVPLLERLVQILHVQQIEGVFVVNFQIRHEQTDAEFVGQLLLLVEQVGQSPRNDSPLFPALVSGDGVRFAGAGLAVGEDWS